MSGIAEKTSRPTDDLVLPFLIESSGIRGRLLRLGQVVDTILTRPGYPQPVAQLLGELLALGGGLASTLKYEGVFTLQIKGEGPIRTMVADMTSAGDLRGYAGFDAEAAAAAEAEGAALEVEPWFGSGHMAFTVDQGEQSERYQGLVELMGPRLADSLLYYFRQSQQINAGIMVAARQVSGSWRAGALLIERIPAPEAGEAAEISQEDWRRALILMSSLTEEELLDPALAPETLLFRLFHEDGVRVFDTRPLAVGCRCTRERLAGILTTLSAEELEHLTVEGALTMTCEFCARDFRFGEAEVAAMKEQGSQEPS